jgi:nitrate reductase NapAB chaperone NapD
MIFTGSLLTYKSESANDVVYFLKQFSEIEIYAISEEKNGIIVVIEAKTEEELEELCSTLLKNENIIDIAHHYLNFEEEVEKIEKGEYVNLSLKGFSKSEQRRSRNKLDEY